MRPRVARVVARWRKRGPRADGPGARIRKARTPVPAGRRHSARCRLPHPPLPASSVLQPFASSSPPLRPLLSPPPPAFSFPIPRVCATLGSGGCVAVPGGWGGRSSFRMRQRTQTIPKGRLRARRRPRAALRMRQRTPTMPKWCAVRPIRRPDRRMKIEGRIYQYLPLSGIRPIPSRSKCLSSSSIHLSRLSL